MPRSIESDREAARQAKEFLISKIVQEAAIEGVALSEIEKKMLYFSEQQQEPDDLFEVNDKFDEEYDAQEYEAKIAGLIKQAYQRDRESSDQIAQQWADEIHALEKEDHYILVMVSQAKLRLPGDHGRFLVSTAISGVIVVLAIAASMKFDLSHADTRILMWAATLAIGVVWIAASPKWRAITRQVAQSFVQGILPSSSRKK
ncbi:MAG TPA: hypothetical protein VFD93_07630 [Candidatus Acidoferrales bacterium]|nr:hypothetical protein [Candidatus Acidoferrales bacterium]